MSKVPIRPVALALRGSAVASGPAASSTPDSATTAAASHTLAEVLADLSSQLPHASSRVLGDEDTRFQRKKNLKILASTFSNSRVATDGLQEWNCPQDVAIMVGIAAACSTAVYQDVGAQHHIPSIPRHTIVQKRYIQPSGSLKACVIYEVERMSIHGLRKTLVVAIRGSNSKFDWLVNMNNSPAPAPGLINLQTTPPLLVHAGFADSARLLVPKLEHYLRVLLMDTTGIRVPSQDISVLFTGHSAGGAVASILRAHFMTFKDTKYPFLLQPNTHFPCITFGEPPAFSSPLSFPPTLGRDQASLQLSIVSEGDPVPRLDTAYAKVLALLLHKADTEPLEFGTQGSLQRADMPLHLPPCSSFHPGQVVLMTCVEEEEDGEEDEERCDLRLFLLPPNILEGLLWANLFEHKMKDRYEPWALQIMNGEFNGRMGWEEMPPG